MSRMQTRLRQFLAAWPQVALVKITQARGSTPRAVDTWMLVSAGAIFGTIGGGRLEFMAIDRAREMIVQGVTQDRLDVPLGPEIGQCCGGRVVVEIALVDDDLRAGLPQRIAKMEADYPSVYVFGGGHVGHALAAVLALLPVHATVVETRPEALEGMPEGIATVASAMPETVVREADKGAAFLVLTHDHALDFLIVAEALKRGDAAYVGMIGSKTKKATFSSWFRREADGSAEALAHLVCPIGGADVKDKRPEVIAALAAAELIRGFAVADPA